MEALRAVAALLAIALLVPLAGCGDDSSGEQLAWLDDPRVIVPPTIETDRILQGDVRNDSGDPIRIEAAKIRVYDTRGRRIKASATFAAGYLHSLYPPTRGPASLPDSELERLGKVTNIEPGKTAQMTVSWREPAGTNTAARIDYGPGSLQIPRPADERPQRNY